MSMRHLAAAERHLALGREIIARQEEIIAKLHDTGQDATRAEALLETFVQVQQAHEEHLQSIRNELESD